MGVLEEELGSNRTNRRKGRRQKGSKRDNGNGEVTALKKNEAFFSYFLVLLQYVLTKPYKVPSLA